MCTPDFVESLFQPGGCYREHTADDRGDTERDGAFALDSGNRFAAAEQRIAPDQDEQRAEHCSADAGRYVVAIQSHWAYFPPHPALSPRGEGCAGLARPPAEPYTNER